MLYSYKVGVVRRLVPCLKCMELACRVLLGHFDPLVSKKVDEKRCFVKKFGFNEFSSQSIDQYDYQASLY